MEGKLHARRVLQQETTTGLSMNPADSEERTFKGTYGENGMYPMF